MMTPCRFLAVAGSVLASVLARADTQTNAAPATAAAAFAAARDEVLAAPSGALSRDGFVFCVGRVRSEPERGTAAGEAKARLAAAARLSAFVRDASPWPEETPEADRSLAWPLLLADAPLELPEASAEPVLIQWPAENLVLSVVAFPEEAVLAARPGTSALVAALDRLRALREADPGRVETETPPPSATAWIEPRGLFETNGVILNETLSDSLL